MGILPIALGRILPDGGARPLLWATDPVTAVLELFRFREPLYERAADFKIDTSKLTVDGVVKKIMGRIQADEGHSP